MVRTHPAPPPLLRTAVTRERTLCCVLLRAAAEFGAHCLPGQFNTVHIVIQPLARHVYRITVRPCVRARLPACAADRAPQVRARPGVPPFGPLRPGEHILHGAAAVDAVRHTAVAADIACRVLYEGQVRALACRRACMRPCVAHDDARSRVQVEHVSNVQERARQIHAALRRFSAV